MVEDKDDGCGEEDGDQTDRQTEDPVVTDSNIKVQGGEHSTPHHYIQHLVEGEERLQIYYTRISKYSELQLATCI